MQANYAFEDLNSAQQQAVQAPMGPLLILAGAGSGKTRTLVQRIHWLIASNAAIPQSIFAVTFTNKAAGEMRARLQKMAEEDVRGIWVGTFHGLSHKLLRTHWQAAGLPEHFQILDSEDQLRLIKRLVKDKNLDDSFYEPKKIQQFVNRKKDAGMRANRVQAMDALEQVYNDVYLSYDHLCRQEGFVDFAELLLRAYELLNDNEDLLLHYQNRFKHFFVDEFQDTNTVQYRWLKILSRQAGSVTVVGDDDQSIYGWRGAKIENIYRFEKDYPNAKIIRLEQNYRSTKTILSAANALIMHNPSRMGKTLWTEGEAGEPIQLYQALNEEDEAIYLVKQIKQWQNQGGHLEDIALLYRSNAQSRVLEEALIRSNLPYRIYGGLRFFERQEIKDALAYLRLSLNPNDDTAFLRVVNLPTRGIGDRSLEKIRALAETTGHTLWEASKVAIEKEQLSTRIANQLNSFLELIQRFNQQVEKASVGEMVETIVKDSGLIQFFKEQHGEKSQSRAENLEELVSATQDYEEENPEWQEDGGSAVQAFLAHVSLDSSSLEEAEPDKPAVQLMTIHAAKGLEFPLVCLCGLEEGLFPHYLSKYNPKALEEERRLCYVGITRAMKKLVMTYAKVRRLFGREEFRRPSLFVQELPQALVKEDSPKLFVRKSHPMTLTPQYPRESRVDTSQSLCVNGMTLSLGQRVNHRKFGLGVVTNFEGQDERTRIQVHFDEVGAKWLVLSFAKLEIV